MNRRAKWIVYATNKIPVYESQVSPASSSGGSFISDAPGRQVGAALGQLGETISGLVEKRIDKTEKAKIVEESTLLQQQSLNTYLDAESNRQGKAALPNEETGDDGVYEDYNNQANQLVEKSLTRIAPKYQDLAREQLGQVANSYRNKFAVFQSAQEASHRKEIMKQNLQATETELYSTMERGGGAEEISATLGRVRELMTLGSGGQEVESQFNAYKAQVVADSIKAAAITDAGRALELLKVDALHKALDPTTIKALEVMLDKQRIVQESDDIVSGMDAKQLPYKARLEVANGIKDKDVRDATYAEVRRQEVVADAYKTKDQFDRVNDYYEKIFNDEADVSISEVRKDASLEFSQREAVVSWLQSGSKKALQYDDVTRWKMWTRMQDNIVAGVADGSLSVNDIRKSVLEGGLDIRDAGRAENEFKVANATGGRTYKAVRSTITRKYASVDEDPQLKQQVIYGTDQYIDEWRSMNRGEPPNDIVEKFVKWSAQGIVEQDFWDGTKEFFGLSESTIHRARTNYPTIHDPQGVLASENDPTRINLVESNVLDLRFNGVKGNKFPRAYYDAERTWYILGQPEAADGMFYIQTQNGKVGHVTVGEWLKGEGQRK